MFVVERQQLKKNLDHSRCEVHLSVSLGGTPLPFIALQTLVYCCSSFFIFMWSFFQLTF